MNPLHEEGRYESALPGTGAGRPHHHLVCISCKKVRDLYDVAPPRIGDAQGFEVRALKVQVEGVCQDCARRRRARNMSSASATSISAAIGRMAIG